ncbi:lactate utilization protein [Romboutsia sp. 1001216sp1]|uniref:lactate utilization protein n=1 Tax=unclassified Romboutsia TaxID=2626894 RepID=UPI001896A94C|nr:lactate utilization protein [Romboutsia sp. 1001216sp1]MDB8790590.1 lactate utilization protein [Romboutsia sp. 1001216sp1]MDB8794153.1 lactate utilization protein [Romboutsia sp. 1001216sp1]MDB8796301.1 lactate utilization protein [Romboutsia sp. 1001216sp1]MDB8797946.1 lactate utilization protein [Romboutsia sp. 1001216sp1]MDB8801323.1 lactate utilization protein [Romboutsia sp. 1001216sp1]
MDKNITWINEKRIEKTIKALEKNNMNGYLAKDTDDIINIIKELVDEKSLVACGGSMTLFKTGIIDLLRSGRYNFLDRYEENLSPQEMKEIFRKSFCADAYFTSTNAITEEGELYNVDGMGNRVAAMLYGPDKVIVVCGVNKIVKNIDEAINRNKVVSAPANAKRLNTKTPCKEVGYCMDCSSSERICCEYTIIKKQRIPNRIHIIFINESFGY